MKFCCFFLVMWAIHHIQMLNVIFMSSNSALSTEECNDIIIHTLTTVLTFESWKALKAVSCVDMTSIFLAVCGTRHSTFISIIARFSAP